jgi:hypothetical protein
MPAFSLKKYEPKESEILASICEYLQAKRLFFWRNNTTGVQRTGPDGRSFWTTNKYALKGVADIIVIKPNGQAIFLECKRPSGYLSPEQKEFERLCIQNNVPFYVVKSIDDVQEIGL